MYFSGSFQALIQFPDALMAQAAKMVISDSFLCHFKNKMLNKSIFGAILKRFLHVLCQGIRYANLLFLTVEYLGTLKTKLCTVILELIKLKSTRLGLCKLDLNRRHNEMICCCFRLLMVRISTLDVTACVLTTRNCQI